MKIFGRWMRGAAITAALTTTACGGGDEDSQSTAPPVAAPTPTPSPAPTTAPVPTPTPSSSEREIEPATADPRVSGFLLPSVAINPVPGTSRRDRLFVMLPGTGGPARAYRLITREAAARGYHAIALTYPNEPAVNDVCPVSPEPDCAEKMRREILFGADESQQVRVGEADSISGRLGALLAYLARIAPTEGWGGYLLADGKPDWSRIAVAGHSQGTGHAALLAKLFALERVGLFAGPGDLGDGGRGLASYVARPNRTPVERIYGFIHRDDDAVPLNYALLQWRTMGLTAFGEPANVDGFTAYAGPSHQLVTTATPRPTTLPLSPLHGATIVDPVTPLTTTGTPQFAGNWTYMLFP